jgi:hypothetical protein
MAKKKNNTLLIVAAVAVGGYLLWKHSQTQVAATMNNNTVAATSPLATTLGFSPVVVSAETDDPRYVEINKWVSTLSIGQGNAVSSALKIMSSAEIDGLNDIVLNDFYGNGITTAAQRAFWDTWRVKYNIPAS